MHSSVIFVCLGMCSLSTHADVISVCPSGCDHDTINAAVDAAEPGDVVQISAGEYVLDAPINPSGKGITIQGAVDPESGEPLTILTPGVVSQPALECTSGENHTTEFMNLVITFGLTGGGNGGVVYNFQSSPTLTNCIFSNNFTANGIHGAAIHNESSSPTLNRCRFNDNQAVSGASGAAIYNFLSDPELNDCTFDDNISNAVGGAIYNVQSNPTLNNCTFDNNQANGANGGAIYNKQSSPILNNCIFNGNLAIFNGNLATGYGGAMYNEQSSPTLNGCELNENEAGNGGAITDDASSPKLNHCTFTGNTAVLSGGGGGGAIYCMPMSTLDMYSCTFTSNEGYIGSAIMTYETNGTMDNCVFENNTASGGYCMTAYRESSPVLQRCVFKNNIGVTAPGGLSFLLDCNPTLIDCTITGNISGGTSTSGGLLIGSNAAPLLIGCSICNNFLLGTPPELSEQIDGIIDPSSTDNCIAVSCGQCDFDGDGVVNDDDQWLYDYDNDGEDDVFDTVFNIPADPPGLIGLAISAALDGHVIQLDPGTYTEPAAINTAGKAITIRGSEVDADGNPTSILDGGNVRQVLQCISGEGADTIFENLMIYRGSAIKGGGMVISSSPTLTNCTFRSNQATNIGGAIFISNSSPAFQGCDFAFNTASQGGGIFNSGGSPILFGCTFGFNLASERGAGMSNFGNSNPTLANCSFTENGAGALGGGMWNSDTSSVDLQDSTFCDNYVNFVETDENQIEGGGINDLGGNCITAYCLDENEDDIPDGCDDDCLGDVNGDGQVGPEDLAMILGAWGQNTPELELTGDDIIDGQDLGTVIGAWGVCDQ